MNWPALLAQTLNLVRRDRYDYIRNCCSSFFQRVRILFATGCNNFLRVFLHFFVNSACELGRISMTAGATGADNWVISVTNVWQLTKPLSGAEAEEEADAATAQCRI